MTPAAPAPYDGVMTDRDAAFLWETEALRAPASPSTRAPKHLASERPDQVSGDDWLTLREASAATGIPVATLRKWALKGRVPSVLDQSTAGARRLVSLEGVQARADDLGRSVGPVGDVIAEEEAAAVVAPDPVPVGEMAPPPGTMIVPIAAWDKMLLQLGNLHEAGQQLAEARERAAKAETEALFLRERLAEMRSTSDTPPGTPRSAAPDEVVDQRRPVPSFTVYLWRSAISGLRRKR
jgi:hypothetical protein